MLIGLNDLEGGMPLPSATRGVGTLQSQEFDSGSLKQRMAREVQPKGGRR